MKNNDWWQRYLEQVYEEASKETDKKLAKLYLQSAERIKREIMDLY